MTINDTGSTPESALIADLAGSDAYAEWYPEFAGKRVLVAEDIAVHADQARNVLQAAGCAQVDVFADGAEALAAARANRYDLMLLDLRMPSMDGVEMLRAIRTGDGPNRETLAMFLTASGEPRQRREIETPSSGLQAEDYFVKPVHDEELVARIGKRLAQRALQDDPALLQNGPLIVDPQLGKAFILDTPLELSPRRFSLLKLLAQFCGRPVTRKMIAVTCWPKLWANNNHELDKSRNESISALIYQLRTALRQQAPEFCRPQFADILVAVPNEGLLMRRLDGTGENTTHTDGHGD